MTFSYFDLMNVTMYVIHVLIMSTVALSFFFLKMIINTITVTTIAVPIIKPTVLPAIHPPPQPNSIYKILTCLMN